MHSYSLWDQTRLLGLLCFPLTILHFTLFILALAASLLTVWFLAYWYKVLRKRVHLWVPHILLPSRFQCKDRDLNAGIRIQSCWLCGSATLLSEAGNMSSGPCQLCSVLGGMTLFAFAFRQNSGSQRKARVYEEMCACDIFVAVAFANANTERDWWDSTVCDTVAMKFERKEEEIKVSFAVLVFGQQM